MKQKFSMHSLGRAALRVVFALLVCSLAVALSTASFAQTKAINGSSKLKPHVVTSFEYDSTHQMLPESITAGPDGKLYAGVSDFLFTGLCYIERLTPDGKQQQVIANFPPSICSNGFLLGVAFDEEDRLYVAVDTFTPDVPPGVYRVEHNGTATRVLSLPPGSFPNGLAFYEGDMYVSDSVLGAIWKKGPHDGSVQTTPWYQNTPLLAPTGFGANGIAFYRHSLYIAVADAGSIVRLSILHDGTPGAWEYVAPPNPLLVTLDGIAFDVTGRLWFTVNYGSDGSGGKLGTLDEDGKLRILGDSPGWLDYPTMVVFGTTYRDRDTLYLTNGGLNGGKPNVLSFDVDVAGLPLPVDH